MAGGVWEAYQPGQTNIWLQTQIAVGGPKVFQPTVEQCLAMEQVAPRIPSATTRSPTRS